MPLDKLLDEAAARGHQAVFRVFLEWPGREGAIPTFLVKDGLKVFKFKDLSAEPPQDNQTPDYTDPKLRAVLMRFIAALGRKYEGDPRIGFITAGLLGGWGEWHGIAPRYDRFADKDLQVSVMKVAGREALDKWKTQPIGGEIRPEAWGIVFDPNPVRKEIQDFHDCVEATHVSWLMDSGMFGQKADVARIQRAVEAVRRMGYDFYVSAVTIAPAQDGRLPLKVEVVNRGVAPFYYDWPVELGLIGAGGQIVKTSVGSGKITDLLPGDDPRIWDEALLVDGIPAGKYKVVVRVPNRLSTGPLIRFANKTQDADVRGWLTLGEILLKAP